ncbi:hypothetical protein [Janibacter anophelis]|uniref:hypothetical protein n=1 Tax=Janibacter anophelis TaxID=319054 RepID=UPI000DEF4097|nr:hypothetical protein [Janibacter anophelis]
MGVHIAAADRLRVGATSPFVLGRMALAVALSGRPRLGGLIDRVTIRILRRRLADYGATG